MKLATAQRKLWPHRKRWGIKIEPSSWGNSVTITIAATTVEVYRNLPDDLHTTRACGDGLAHAMALAAEQIERLERVIECKRAYDEAVKEARR